MGLAAIDIVFIVVIIIFALHTCVKGFVSEVMSLSAAILGVLSAIFLFRRGALFIRETYNLEIKILPEIIAFVVIFLAVFAAIKILEVMLKNIIEGIKLGGIDRVLGFLFGFAEGIIIVCLILFLISIQPLFDPGKILGRSFFAELLLPFIMGIKGGAGSTVVLMTECMKEIYGCV